MLNIPTSVRQSGNAPRVSIGIPVFNGEAWIADAIDSILAQTYQNFELIISDNASSDSTVEICRRYVSADSRVRLLTNARNIGANRNYLAVLSAATAPLFKWASCNDICAPTFIERCVTALVADPSAVLACPRAWVFENSADAAQPYEDDLELLSNSPAERFIAVLNSMALNNATNGVIRRDALTRVRQLGTYGRADIVLMAELALIGKFILVDERLFYRRMSAESATRLKSAREAELHLVPDSKSPLKWQHWIYHWAVLRAATRAPFANGEWIRAMRHSLREIIWSRHHLLRDARRAIARSS